MRDWRTKKYWLALFAILSVTTLATVFIESAGFWSGYVYDIVFPAWLYIYMRELYWFRLQHRFSRLFVHFSPNVTIGVILGVTFTLETSQFTGIYKGYFDPYDYFAFVALLIPIYLVDMLLINRKAQTTNRD